MGCFRLYKGDGTSVTFRHQAVSRGTHTMYFLYYVWHKGDGIGIW